jgi:hypothetical protein
MRIGGISISVRVFYILTTNARHDIITDLGVTFGTLPSRMWSVTSTWRVTLPNTGWFVVYKRAKTHKFHVQQSTEVYQVIPQDQRTDTMATPRSYLVIGGAGAQGLPVVKGTIPHYPSEYNTKMSQHWPRTQRTQSASWPAPPPPRTPSFCPRCPMSPYT